MTEVQADYNYIMRGIDGCATNFQIIACYKLIELFEDTHGDEQKAKCLTELLKSKSDHLQGIFSGRTPQNAKARSWWVFNENGIPVRVAKGQAI